jgi:hypothetical protein
MTRQKTGGRQVGTPNKATTDARRAIADFVDGNAHRLTEWLDSVAQGVRDADGNIIVPPNPSKAFDMFQSVVEYHVPKLARHELTGDKENPVEISLQGQVFGELISNLKMKRQSEGK